jgi:hypothetical protein
MGVGTGRAARGAWRAAARRESEQRTVRGWRLAAGAWCRVPPRVLRATATATTTATTDAAGISTGSSTTAQAPPTTTPAAAHSTCPVAPRRSSQARRTGFASKRGGGGGGLLERPSAPKRKVFGTFRLLKNNLLSGFFFFGTDKLQS